jgi:hypothetical protein
MPELLHRTTARVFVDAATVDLVAEDLVAEFEPEWETNGLADADPGGDAVRVLCGQEIGSVTVTAELWDAPPGWEAEEWQDAAEISAVWTSAAVDFGTTTTGEEPDPERCLLPLTGPGEHRFRVYGRHRDDGDPRDPGAPQEEYLIQIWRGPGGPPVLRKRTSLTAVSWTE